VSPGSFRPLHPGRAPQGTPDPYTAAWQAHECNDCLRENPELSGRSQVWDVSKDIRTRGVNSREACVHPCVTGHAAAGATGCRGDGSAAMGWSGGRGTDGTEVELLDVGDGVRHRHRERLVAAAVPRVEGVERKHPRVASLLLEEGVRHLGSRPALLVKGGAGNERALLLHRERAVLDHADCCDARKVGVATASVPEGTSASRCRSRRRTHA